MCLSYNCLSKWAELIKIQFIYFQKGLTAFKMMQSQSLHLFKTAYSAKQSILFYDAVFLSNKFMVNY